MYKWQKYKELTAVTTTREGGYSKAGYHSANLALHVGDDLETVRRNRRKTFGSPLLNLDEKNCVFVAQYHSDITRKVSFSEAGKGFETFESGIPADALYTKEKGLTLGIYHADCVPLFVYVPNHQLIGIIHAGEKGSLANISGKFMTQIMNNEAVKAEEIFIHLGPALSFAHRLISKERAETLAALGGDIQKAVKGTHPQYFLDLPLLNILQLRRVGIPFENITFSEECTYENNDRYFSYAKEKITGRNMSFIRLNR
ncbi:MAG: polyphenol oxidase family protein [Bacilli bacterium]